MFACMALMLCQPKVKHVDYLLECCFFAILDGFILYAFVSNLSDAECCFSSQSVQKV